MHLPRKQASTLARLPVFRTHLFLFVIIYNLCLTNVVAELDCMNGCLEGMTIESWAVQTSESLSITYSFPRATNTCALAFFTVDLPDCLNAANISVSGCFTAVSPKPTAAAAELKCPEASTQNCTNAPCSQCFGSTDCCSDMGSPNFGACGASSAYNCPDGSRFKCNGGNCPTNLTCNQLNDDPSFNKHWGYTTCPDGNCPPGFGEGMFCYQDGGSNSLKVCCSFVHGLPPGPCYNTASSDIFNSPFRIDLNTSAACLALNQSITLTVNLTQWPSTGEQLYTLNNATVELRGVDTGLSVSCSDCFAGWGFDCGLIESTSTTTTTATTTTTTTELTASSTTASTLDTSTVGGSTSAASSTIDSSSSTTVIIQESTTTTAEATSSTTDVASSTIGSASSTTAATTDIVATSTLSSSDTTTGLSSSTIDSSGTTTATIDSSGTTTATIDSSGTTTATSDSIGSSTTTGPVVDSGTTSGPVQSTTTTAVASNSGPIATGPVVTGPTAASTGPVQSPTTTAASSTTTGGDSVSTVTTADTLSSSSGSIVSTSTTATTATTATTGSLQPAAQSGSGGSEGGDADSQALAGIAAGVSIGGATAGAAVAFGAYRLWKKRKQRANAGAEAPNPQGTEGVTSNPLYDDPMSQNNNPLYDASTVEYHDV